MIAKGHAISTTRRQKSKKRITRQRWSESTRKRWKQSVVRLLMLKRGRKRGSGMRKVRNGQRSVRLRKSIRRTTCLRRQQNIVELITYAIYIKSLSLY